MSRKLGIRQSYVRHLLPTPVSASELLSSANSADVTKIGHTPKLRQTSPSNTGLSFRASVQCQFSGCHENWAYAKATSDISFQHRSQLPSFHSMPIQRMSRKLGIRQSYVRHLLPTPVSASELLSSALKEPGAARLLAALHHLATHDASTAAGTTRRLTPQRLAAAPGKTTAV